MNRISCQHNYKGEQPCSAFMSTIADKTTVVLKFTTIPQITCSCVVSATVINAYNMKMSERTLLDTQLRMTLRYGIIKHCCIHHLTCQISLCSATSTMSVRGVPAVDIAPMPEDAMTKVQDLLLPDLVYILIILFLLNAGHVSLS